VSRSSGAPLAEVVRADHALAVRRLPRDARRSGPARGRRLPDRSDGERVPRRLPQVVVALLVGHRGFPPGHTGRVSGNHPPGPRSYRRHRDVRGAGRGPSPTEPEGRPRSEARPQIEKPALPPLRAGYGLPLRLTGDRLTAEDLAQETFLKAFKAFGTLRDS